MGMSSGSNRITLKQKEIKDQRLGRIEIFRESWVVMIEVFLGTSSSAV